MLTEQRFEVILKELREKGSVTVAELTRLLGTSESTIRRDLNTLDEEGKLTKVFGGAVALDTTFSSVELSVSQKSGVNVPEKQRIAEYASTLVEPDDLVFIDAGTTTEYIIDYLKEKRAVYVTNAVSHARKLSVAGFKVELIGGELKAITEAVVGSRAIISLQRFNFNKGFFGTNGISIQNGLTTPDVNEALVKETAFKRSLNRYVLADNGKFGKVSSVTFAGIKDCTIITDKKPEEKYADNTRVIIV
ncbi:MAG: DeoR/GlpR family DNA-binding transcription regulator [Eubacteriales bacterium]|nr:DeoR/GlpR family DNA-binding transcription regulator [Eubacteriales bacterium]